MVDTGLLQYLLYSTTSTVNTSEDPLTTSASKTAVLRNEGHELEGFASNGDHNAATQIKEAILVSSILLETDR